MKKRRRSSRRVREPLVVPRFAPGRVEGALDWVAGPGWQDPRTGRVHIELPLALHHDQGRAFQRAVDALRRFPRILRPLFRLTDRDIEVVSMPLSAADADRMHQRLSASAVSGPRELRQAIRIGIGAASVAQPLEVPTTYRTMASTKADGTLIKPMDDTWMAVVDPDGRVDGARDAGKPSGSIVGIDDEARWAAGTGMRTTPEGVPDVLVVLAVGATARAAGRRAAAVAFLDDLVVGDIIVKVAPIHAVDGLMLRQNLESALADAERRGDATAVGRIGIALGRSDQLVDDTRVDVTVEDLPDSGVPEDEDCATLTVDADGLAQLWDAGRKPVRYWRESEH